MRLYHLTVPQTPATAAYAPPIEIMPLGLMALGDALQRAGHAVELVHAGVEARLDPHFSVAEDLAADPPDLVGLTLHWHHQLGPVAALLDALAEHGPALPLVLGGFTASAFAADLVRRFPALHAVVRGEGEAPLTALAAALAQSDPAAALAAVPNLVYRAVDGTVATTPLAYVAGQAELDALCFARFDLLRHAAHYNAQFAAGVDGFANPPIFYLAVGRGCSVDCAFCAGGVSGHRALAGRRKVLFRSSARVIDDLRAAVRQGITSACICFDPPPHAEAYFIDLFRAIRAAELDVALVFECYRPPSAAFIAAFDETFRRAGRRLTFSATVGDEGLRARLMGIPFPNAALEQALHDCATRGIPTTVYFATLPHESRAQLEASLAWQRTLVERFGAALIHAPIEMEPLAPWADPARGFGLAAVRDGLAAYEARHRPAAGAAVSFAAQVGYAFPDVDARVVRIRSALVDPPAALGRALATCGQGCGERLVLAAPGQFEAALRAAADWRGAPVDLFAAPGEADPTDWALLERLADRLGAHVRLIGLPRGVQHRLWSGRRAPPPLPPDAALLVLELRDGDAALALAAGGAAALAALPPGAILAHECRFALRPCPAQQGRMRLVAADGGVHPCPAGPALSGDPAALAVLAERTALRRGCARCPVAEHCARCLFPGRIPEALYCAARRALGPAGLAGGSWRRPAGAGPAVAVNWDG